jgi:hypothetical protein
VSKLIKHIENILKKVRILTQYLAPGGDVGFYLGQNYGPSTWYGKNDYKWFE